MDLESVLVRESAMIEERERLATVQGEDQVKETEDQAKVQGETEDRVRVQGEMEERVKTETVEKQGGNVGDGGSREGIADEDGFRPTQDDEWGNSAPDKWAGPSRNIMSCFDSAELRYSGWNYNRGGRLPQWVVFRLRLVGRDIIWERGFRQSLEIDLTYSSEKIKGTEQTTFQQARKKKILPPSLSPIDVPEKPEDMRDESADSPPARFAVAAIRDEIAESLTVKLAVAAAREESADGASAVGADGGEIVDGTSAIVAGGDASCVRRRDFPFRREAAIISPAFVRDKFTVLSPQIPQAVSPSYWMSGDIRRSNHPSHILILRMATPHTADLYKRCRIWEAAILEAKQLPQEELHEVLPTLLIALTQISATHTSLPDEEKRIFVLPRMVLSATAEILHARKTGGAVTNFDIQRISKSDDRIQDLPAFDHAYWDVETISPDLKPIELTSEEEGIKTDSEDGATDEEEFDELIASDVKDLDVEEKKPNAGGNKRSQGKGKGVSKGRGRKAGAGEGGKAEETSPSRVEESGDESPQPARTRSQTSKVNATGNTKAGGKRRENLLLKLSKRPASVVKRPDQCKYCKGFEVDCYTGEKRGNSCWICEANHRKCIKAVEEGSKAEIGVAKAIPRTAATPEIGASGVEVARSDTVPEAESTSSVLRKGKKRVRLAVDAGPEDVPNDVSMGEEDYRQESLPAEDSDTLASTSTGKHQNKDSSQDLQKRIATLEKQMVRLESRLLTSEQENARLSAAVQRGLEARYYGELQQRVTTMTNLVDFLTQQLQLAMKVPFPGLDKQDN
ncbi:hypothetical protein BDN72DRAFT_865280 [Pluteus cervinus]|uniref:Uncharacterized protein n=1 Tax=Pluteus cervinus TaxID=181527 RepID=A0ACD3A354_9AGAR|nr:hypothetical protein BDN72DRAFT_865280 [Pluteus cervinus]